jgi:hypothetical protein
MAAGTNAENKKDRARLGKKIHGVGANFNESYLNRFWILTPIIPQKTKHCKNRANQRAEAVVA